MDLETAVCYLCQEAQGNIDDVFADSEEDLLCPSCLKDIYHDHLTATMLEEDLCDDDPDHDVEWDKAIV